jgi:SAM-dependent methyltransferase
LHAGLIEEARRLHGEVPGLSFETADVYNLSFHDLFDIVTAARVLQWLANPLVALQKIATAAKPGGRVVILEYNHEKIAWQPQPPLSMQEFYAAFLRWRADAGMDNAIADHLAEMFARAGLTDILITPQAEITRRGDPDFATRISIWAEVAASRGHQMVADGVIGEDLRAAAETDYRNWLDQDAASQTMYLLSVEGVRP